MYAVTVSEFGGPEVLTEAELPDLSPAPGEVSINVTHAAVGLVDTLFRRGDLKDAPGELGKKPPFVPGRSSTPAAGSTPTSSRKRKSSADHGTR